MPSLIEYVTNVTQNGTRIELPNWEGFELRTCEGEHPFTTRIVHGHKIVCRGKKLDRVSDEKRVDKERVEALRELIEKITLTAMNCTTSKQFYNKCAVYCANAVDNWRVSYEDKKAEWDELLNSIVLEIANKLAAVAYTERNMKGAQTMLSMLTTRMEAWQKKANVEINKQEDGGGFQFIVQGTI